MKIAAFKMTGTSYWTSYWSQKDGSDGVIDGYIRMSEWVDVEFPPRAPEAMVPEEVAQLDAKLEELKADFAKKVNAIEEAKQNLLAIADQRPVFVESST